MIQCPKCNRYLEGYRCPHCKYFLLDDPVLKRKKYSLYHHEMNKDNKKVWPYYLLLFLIVGGLLSIMSYFLLMLK